MSNIDVELGRQVRHSIGRGAPLDQGLRSLLEEYFCTDLGEVRFHTSDEADRLARRFGADAFTVGADVFFRDSCLNPGTQHGLSLIAHEVAHALQQASATAKAGPDRVVPAHDSSEDAADRSAAHVLRGRRVESTGKAPRRTIAEDPLLIQCHSTWEHWLLGNITPEALDKMVSGDSSVSTDVRDNILALWLETPNASLDAIQKHLPGVNTLKLENDLVVTEGDLNGLADYVAGPVEFDLNAAKNRTTTLKILQSGRQETYNHIDKMLLGGAGRKLFSNSAVPDLWPDIGILDDLDKGTDVFLMDLLTSGLGQNGKDHYNGLLARNAAHFAPFSWWRWRMWYDLAASYAREAYSRGGDPTRARIARIYCGHANHFLQDSFAAGHLINKTLVMQWYVEWLDARTDYHEISGWGSIRGLKTDLQPYMAGAYLYTASDPTKIVVTDPQSGQELHERADRIKASGVVGNKFGTQEENYIAYLRMLSSGLIQLCGAASLHDDLCKKSAWVASPKHPTPYQVWGDDTMLKGGEGAKIIAETSRSSWGSIEHIIRYGTPGGDDAKSIMANFPTRAALSSDRPLQDLWTWHQLTLKDHCKNTIFPDAWASFKAEIVSKFPSMGKVSVDL